MSAFHDPREFETARVLESNFAKILGELRALALDDFVESPDSLTTVDGAYDERGWRAFALFGDAAECAANRLRCPATASICREIAGLRNAGFSLFRPGTHLYPHRGELAGVLRCHLGLVIPSGDLGLRIAGETRVWRPGKCLVFDDTAEHEAWNHTGSDRVVLIVTFEKSGTAAR